MIYFPEWLCQHGTPVPATVLGERPNALDMLCGVTALEKLASANPPA
jgi:hypothetical protein